MSDPTAGPASGSSAVPMRCCNGSTTLTGIAVFLVVMTVAMTIQSSRAAQPEADGILAVKERVEALEATLAEGRPKRAAADFQAVADSLAGVLNQPRPPAGAKVLQDRLRRIRDTLELEGLDVSVLTVPVARPAGRERPPAKPVDAVVGSGPPGFTRPSTPTGPAVSFSRDVAGMLVRSCGGCHVRGRKGNFQMASFDALAKSGMVQAGDAQSSRLVEVIRSGDMPRGGGSVAAHDMAMLMKWIDAGAVFDGAEATTPLESLATAAPPVAGQGQAGPAVKVPAARPPVDGVSFAFDIAPVLLEHCGGCHGGRRPRGELRMQSHESLLRGGESGEVVLPGKGSESLLVRKLTGMKIDGQRMPLGKPPLPDDVVAMIKRWIDEGAALDLLTPTASLETLAAAGRAAKLSHEALREVRFTAGAKFWKRAIPDEEGVAVRRDDVVVIGNLPAEELTAVAEEAQAMATSLRGKIGFPEGQPLAKGSCVLCVCQKSADYSSFWQTILSMERPRELACHSGLTGDVLYGAFLVPKEGLDASKADVSGMLAEQLATAAWLSRGAPEWFSVGAGRVAAATLAPKSPRILAWNASKNVTSLPSAAAFLGPDIDPEERARVAHEFISVVAGRGGLSGMARAIGGSTGFEAAFTKTFGSSPEAVYTRWAGR